MRAVVFKDVKKVELEDRPVPTIQDPKDIIVKVQYTALCGRYIKFLFHFVRTHLLAYANVSSHSIQ
jgi:D-arabinose 1-dehydrogenase-like Zn-dependent alcohol dehydrogenase